MFLDIGKRGRSGLIPPERIVAHLSLHAARIAAPAAGDDSFVQDLLQHSLMERVSLLRGE